MRKGFTLLELVIVIIIIGILVAMALPQFTRMAERGRSAKAKSALDMVRKAEAIWFATHSAYTDVWGDLDDEIPELATYDPGTETDPDWNFSLVATPTTFSANAVRMGGLTGYIGTTINIDQEGTWSGDNPFATGL